MLRGIFFYACDPLACCVQNGDETIIKRRLYAFFEQKSATPDINQHGYNSIIKNIKYFLKY